MSPEGTARTENTEVCYTYAPPTDCCRPLTFELYILSSFYTIRMCHENPTRFLKLPVILNVLLLFIFQIPVLSA